MFSFFLSFFYFLSLSHRAVFLDSAGMSWMIRTADLLRVDFMFFFLFPHIPPGLQRSLALARRVIVNGSPGGPLLLYLVVCVC